MSAARTVYDLSTGIEPGQLVHDGGGAVGGVIRVDLSPPAGRGEHGREDVYVLWLPNLPDEDET